MIKTLRALAATAALAAATVSAWGQNELIVSQYMHNYFAVNPAFAGSREGLSLFGGFRKQWASIESSPTSAILTANTPMRHEKLTGGLSIYHQAIHVSTNTGVMATVGYRTRVGRRATLGLALQPGVAIRSRNWEKVRTMDGQDDAFAEKETNAAPILGVGVSLYGDKFFAGISTTSLIVTDDFERKDTKFAPADATYVACGGYWFDLGADMALQPSVLADYSKKTDAAATLSVSAIWREKVWLTLAGRTTKDATIGAAYKPNPRLKVAYSYTMSLGPLNGYESGSHEITLQYDLVYKIKAVGPRFY